MQCHLLLNLSFLLLHAPFRAFSRHQNYKLAAYVPNIREETLFFVFHIMLSYGGRREKNSEHCGILWV